MKKTQIQNGIIKIYLGKTIFQCFLDTNETFIPFNDEQVRKFFNEKNEFQFSKPNSKNLNMKDILMLCEEGKGEIIKLEYSPFLLKLDETLFIIL